MRGRSKNPWKRRVKHTAEKADVLKDLRAVSRALGAKFTLEEYNRIGRYSGQTAAKFFGSVAQIRKKIGLLAPMRAGQVPERHMKALAKKKLLAFFREQGRPPTRREWAASLQPPSASWLGSKYGGFQGFLKKCKIPPRFFRRDSLWRNWESLAKDICKELYGPGLRTRFFLPDVNREIDFYCPKRRIGIEVKTSFYCDQFHWEKQQQDYLNSGFVSQLVYLILDRPLDFRDPGNPKVKYFFADLLAKKIKKGSLKRRLARLTTRKTTRADETFLYRRDEIVEAIREYFERHGNIPSLRDFTKGSERFSSYAPIYDAFGTWNNALFEAGFPAQKTYSSTVDTNFQKKRFGAFLRAFKEKNGRYPYGKEYSRLAPSLRLPDLRRFKKIFSKSYRGYLKEIGIELTLKSRATPLDQHLSRAREGGFRLMSLEMKNGRTRACVECTKCGLQSMVKSYRLIEGCKRCSIAGHIAGLKKTQGALSVDAKKAGLSILNSHNYVNAQTKLMYQCLYCGKKMEKKPNNVQQGKGCRSCSQKKRHLVSSRSG
jgi:hypothetical protein